MIEKVLANPRELLIDRNTKLSQVRRGANPRAEQDRRRAIRPGTEHDLSARNVTAVVQSDAGGATLLKNHPIDEGIGANREVASRARRGEIGKCSIHSDAIGDVFWRCSNAG